jgi:hypothetical protein
MAGMLSKAAHIVNLLALIPAAFCGYVAWIATHPHQYQVPPTFVSIKNVVISLCVFFGLYLLSMLLGLIALLRGNSRPVQVQSS